MACRVARPDPQLLFNKIRDMFSANVLGGAPVIPESNEWYVVSNDYAMQEQFYAIADQMWRETNPETACCDNLMTIAARNGVFPNPATFAQGYMKLSGTAAAPLPELIEINTSNGAYVSTGTIPTQLDSTGSATIRVKASTPGAAGNAAGTVTTGTLTTPIPNVNSEVIICGGNFCGGAEAEDCEAFRTRYLDRMAYKPRATASWIKSKLLEWPCATRVCSREGSCCKCLPECDNCGCKACGDRLEFYVLFDTSFPCGIPTANIVQDIRTWMFGEHQGYGEGQVEVGVCGNIILPSALMIDVYLDIADCMTLNQKNEITNNIRDLFSTICPSQTVYKRQVELIIAQTLGAAANIDVRFDMLGADASLYDSSNCGDIEPACDVMICLNNLIFTTPDVASGPC